MLFYFVSVLGSRDKAEQAMQLTRPRPGQPEEVGDEEIAPAMTSG